MPSAAALPFLALGAKMIPKSVISDMTLVYDSS